MKKKHTLIEAVVDSIMNIINEASGYKFHKGPIEIPIGPNLNAVKKKPGLKGGNHTPKLDKAYFKDKFEKQKFTDMLKRRVRDTENEEYHDDIKEYLNGILHTLGDSFSETWNPELGVKDGMETLKDIITDWGT